MPSTLTGAQKATYDSIFSHPVSHNLEWRSLIAVFNQLGDLEEEPNGKMKFSRNGQTLTLHSRGKDVEVEEIMHIRRFLEKSEEQAKPKGAVTNDVMVVLDHSGARIYRGSAEVELVLPLDPSGHDQQVHNPNGDSGGKQGPLRKLFHDALAKKLATADRILLIGDGQGASSEIEHFVTELKANHHELSQCIVGAEVADISHMTEGDFVAKARDFFSADSVDGKSTV